MPSSTCFACGTELSATSSTVLCQEGLAHLPCWLDWYEINKQGVHKENGK